VVGANAPPAESSAPAPPQHSRGNIRRKWVSTHTTPRVSRSLGRDRTATVLPYADFDRSAAGHDSPENGLGRGGKHHARADPLRRRLKEPDRRLRSLTLPVGEIGHHPASLLTTTGALDETRTGPSKPTTQSTRRSHRV
jgi:hypothetical protein